MVDFFNLITESLKVDFFQSICKLNQLVKVACPQCELKRWEEVENAAHINDYRGLKKIEIDQLFLIV